MIATPMDIVQLVCVLFAIEYIVRKGFSITRKRLKRVSCGWKIYIYIRGKVG